MSTTRATIDQTSSFQIAGVSPIGGALTGGDGTAVSESWTTGTGSRQFNKAGTFTYTIAASATKLVDLQADLGLDGVALLLIEVRHLRIQADSTNVSKVTVEPDATLGWLGWLQAAGDIMDIGPSETVGFTAPIDGSKTAVSGTAKELLITNTDGANAAIVRLEVLGTDA